MRSNPVASEEIVRFFIEEGKEHLNTLENGLLDLPATVQNSEEIDEMFRAAHSVKGGAAMLGYGSIQKVAHRLEDYFKVLKQETLPIDRKLESLFLQGVDSLRELLELLQSPFGLRDEDADEVFSRVEPAFGELEAHLKHLQSGGSPVDTPAAGSSAQPQGNIQNEVSEILRQMLSLFRQQESSETRQKLAVFCQHLQELASDSSPWTALTDLADRAVRNENNPYRILAPVVIVELREASEAIAAGDENAISPSFSLKHLAEAEPGAWGHYALIRSDPASAVKALTDVFEKPQLMKLAKMLYKVAQA
nr:Hpt domain-containing protein [Geitlerinema sp. P-1104]